MVKLRAGAQFPTGLEHLWHNFRNLDEASNVMADKKEASKEEEIQRRSNIYISYLNDPTEAGMKRHLAGF